MAMQVVILLLYLTQIGLTLNAELSLEHTLMLGEPINSLSFNQVNGELVITSEETLAYFTKDSVGKLQLARNITQHRGNWNIKAGSTGAVGVLTEPKGWMFVSKTFEDNTDVKVPAVQFNEHGAGFPTCLTITPKFQPVVGISDGSLEVFSLDSSGKPSLFQTIKSGHEIILKVASASNTLVSCGYENFLEVYKINPTVGQFELAQVLRLEQFEDFSSCNSLDVSASATHIAASKLDDQIYVFEKGNDSQYRHTARFRPQRSVHQAAVKWASYPEFLLVVQERNSIGLWTSSNSFERPIYYKEGRYLPIADWSNKDGEFVIATETGAQLYKLSQSASLASQEYVKASYHWSSKAQSIIPDQER